MTCTKGLVGNLSTEKKGGSRGLQTQYRPTEAFLPCQFYDLMCQCRIWTPQRPNRIRSFSVVWIPCRFGESEPISRCCWKNPLTEGCFFLERKKKKKQNRPKGIKCFRPWCVCTVRALGGLWVAAGQRLKTWWNSEELPYLTQPLLRVMGFNALCGKWLACVTFGGLCWCFTRRCAHQYEIERESETTCFYYNFEYLSYICKILMCLFRAINNDKNYIYWCIAQTNS